MFFLVVLLCHFKKLNNMGTTIYCAEKNVLTIIFYFLFNKLAGAGFCCCSPIQNASYPSSYLTFLVLSSPLMFKPLLSSRQWWGETSQKIFNCKESKIADQKNKLVYSKEKRDGSVTPKTEEIIPLRKRDPK